MRYVVSIILLFTLFSCSKHKNDIQEYELSGNFEWYYSYDSPTTSITSDQVDDQYGIRIKESGRVIFFKNGKELDRFKILSIYDESDWATIPGIKITYKIDKFKRGTLIWDGQDLFHLEWPFQENTNKFLKI